MQLTHQIQAGYQGVVPVMSENQFEAEDREDPEDSTIGWFCCPCLRTNKKEKASIKGYKEISHDTNLNIDLKSDERDEGNFISPHHIFEGYYNNGEQTLNSIITKHLGGFRKKQSMRHLAASWSNQDDSEELP